MPFCVAHAVKTADFHPVTESLSSVIKHLSVSLVVLKEQQCESVFIKQQYDLKVVQHPSLTVIPGAERRTGPSVR